MFMWAILVLAAGAIIAIVNVSLKVATLKSLGLAPLSAYFFTVGLGMLAYGLYTSGVATSLQNFKSPEGLKIAAAAGLAGLLSNVLLYTAMSTAPAGLGYTMFNVASTLGTVLIGVLWLKEAITPIQAAGVGMAVLGVVLVTWKV